MYCIRFIFIEVDETASPALFIALHVYTPESSDTVELMSNVTKPKSFVTWNLEPILIYYNKMYNY